MAGRMWIFDSRQAPRGENTFTPIRDNVDSTGRAWCFALGGGRYFWTPGTKDRKTPLRLLSAPVSNPDDIIDHGLIVDGDRFPQWPGDMITDGKGTVYMVARWWVTDEDMKDFGIERKGMKIGVMFSVIDVSKDLPKE
jgi:hypothetical protein